MAILGVGFIAGIINFLKSHEFVDLMAYSFIGFAILGLLIFTVRVRGESSA